MASEVFDLLIVGGGINGVGIARDAAGRGLKVLLVEQHDLASHTSSRSTKLIHGGLRYLEQYEFRLVREALQERERLLKIAPTIAWPLRFILPHDRSLRPVWLIRAGLFLYDHIGGRISLPRSHGVRLREDPVGQPLKASFTRGFAYSDAWVQDSRLVTLNAMDAAERGAVIRTRTRLTHAERQEGVWKADLQPEGGPAETVRAHALVNAAGPWVDTVVRKALGLEEAVHVRMVKGSHIVVPRLYDGDQAYILQNRDKRIVFAIPYEDRFTLIGTTDEPFKGDPTNVEISAEETDYLCRIINQYFERQIAPSDVVWSYAGVRPLYDDAAANASTVTRDYVLRVDGGEDGHTPLLSIYGGKITTYRRLAEHAMEKLVRYFKRPDLPGLNTGWTDTKPLPGGDIESFEAFLAAFRARHPWLPEALSLRLAHAYGSRAELLIGDTEHLEDLGRNFGGGLTEAEADYLMRHEWARTAEDVLWRRSKVGLHAPPETASALDAWMAMRAKQLAAA
ncbi:MAG: glycerol-3-phosphate dehydrogenase [Caulobacterales bacterium 68-7]|nr:glycerol-3-phosphate dehydrogenase [Caulobacterales bacterium]OJU13821.1 MAG: glycerol-3-phosphate dehydrogenase [Caulobacterales bacterium 68-7]